MSHELEESIFAEVLGSPKSDWQKVIQARCGNNLALQEKVEALLDAHQNPASFWGSPETGGEETAPFPDQVDGQQIGNYKLLQKIGEGGFGVVYMAEQVEPVRRKVALKIIKPGMDSKAVIARFEAERQALAMMDHTNIATVFDGGTIQQSDNFFGSSQLPYFVMELVKGIPITEFCDKNAMSTQGRLQLFSTVCSAVGHAHQKGIIHRDIKPSNVMVTLHDGIPVVKVIDFGVAKATQHRLTEQTMFTQYGQMIGTPQYMSPEQAEMSGLDVDTRSDIYSLGVLLYELLTGTTPLETDQLRTAGYAEIQRLIRDQEPPRPSLRVTSAGDQLTVIAKHRSVEPSQLSKAIRGDLDWIVMKALSKDRGRRYETTRDFIGDVKNLLEEKPVIARPPSMAYLASKFLRRNQVLVLVSLLITATLIGATVLSSRGLIRAREAEAGLAGQITKLEQATQRNRELADQAQSAAHDSKRVAQQSDSVRLAAHAANLVDNNPGLSLCLAVEAAERALEVNSLHMTPLLDALRKNRELKTITIDQFLEHGKSVSNETIKVKLLVPIPGTNQVLMELKNRSERAMVIDLESNELVCRLGIPSHDFEVARISPDGRTVATVGKGIAIARLRGQSDPVTFTDRVIRIWDLQSGNELHVLRGHSERVMSICFHPDGDRLTSCSSDGSVRIWNASTGECMKTLVTTEVPEDVVRLDAKDSFVSRSSPGTDSGSGIGKRSLSSRLLRGLGYGGERNELQPDVIASIDSDKPAPLGFVQYSADGERLLAVAGTFRFESSLELSGDKIVDADYPTGTEFDFYSPTVYTSSKRRSGSKGKAWIWQPKSESMMAQISFAGNTGEPVSASFLPGSYDIAIYQTNDPGFCVVDGTRFEHKSSMLFNQQQMNSNVMLQSYLESEKLDLTFASVPPVKYKDEPLPLIVGAKSLGRKGRWRLNLSSAIELSNSKTLIGLTSDGLLHCEAVGTDMVLKISGQEAGQGAGQEILLSGHVAEIQAMAMHGDSTILSASRDGTIRMWTLEQPDVPEVIQHPSANSTIGFAMFDRTGQSILTSGPGLRAGSWQSFQNTGFRSGMFGDSAYVAPVGNRSDNVPAVFRRKKNSITDPKIYGQLVSMNFSPDGKKLVTVYRDNHVIGPDETTIQSSNPEYKPVVVWDVPTGKKLYELSGLKYQIESASFSPDGKYLMTVCIGGSRWVRFDRQGNETGSASSSLNRGKVDLWDVATGRHRMELINGMDTDSEEQIQSAIWSPDSQSVLFNQVRPVNSLRVLDVETGKENAVIDTKDVISQIIRMEYTPDGMHVVGTDTRAIYSWSVQTGRLDTVIRTRNGERVRGFAISPDSRQLLAHYQSGQMDFFSLETARHQASANMHSRSVNSAMYSRDGKFILTASRDGSARVWCSEDGRQWLKVGDSRSPVARAEFHPNGQSFITVVNDEVKSWPLNLLEMARKNKPRNLMPVERRNYPAQYQFREKIDQFKPQG